MEGATLTFRFVEEGGGARGPSNTPQPVEGQVDQSVSATQAAITNAGGVGSFVNKNNPQPVPPSTSFQVPQAAPLTVPPVPTVTSSSDPLQSTVSKLVQADPNVTAAELAKALGINQTQAQSLLSQAIGTPPPQLATPPSPTQKTPSDSLIFPEDLKRLEEDKWIRSEQERLNNEHETERQRRDQEAKEAANRIATPPALTRDQILEESGRRAPPLPTSPNPLTPVSGQGVINTINSLAHFAQAGGPMGSAAAGLATATANLPGVAGGIAAAAPGLISAAPYVALAGAALAVPAAGAAALNDVFANVRSQLQGLDPRVASAEAEANVRQILANFRTSARLGDEIAEGIEIRSRRSAALQGIRDVVSEVPLQRFNDAANGFTKILELVNDNLQKSPVAQAAVQGAANSWLDSVLIGMGGIGTAILGAELLGKIMNKGDEIKNDNPLTFWQNKPLPKLPAPFTEAGEAVRPKVNPASFGPGLGISF